MRVHVVSDVHGNVDALANAGTGADALLVLGDLIDFVDYHDHSAGILGAVFGAAAVRRYAQLRSGGARVLCSHIPPAVPELVYDVHARRPETGSEQLLGFDPSGPATCCAVRARAPAAGPAGPGRAHRMRQRGALPADRDSARAAVVTAR